MTTIAYRNGIMAADSRLTYEGDASGTRVHSCVKLFRKADAIIGLQGESTPGLVFLDWYGSDRDPPGSLIEAESDFCALVLTRKGLFEFDAFCRGERVIDRFYAIGSGAKAALGAMHMGASAARAVAIACRIDPYTARPIKSMRL